MTVAFLGATGHCADWGHAGSPGGAASRRRRHAGGEPRRVV